MKLHYIDAIKHRKGSDIELSGKHKDIYDRAISYYNKQSHQTKYAFMIFMFTIFSQSNEDNYKTFMDDISKYENIFKMHKDEYMGFINILKEGYTLDIHYKINDYLLWDNLYTRVTRFNDFSYVIDSLILSLTNILHDNEPLMLVCESQYIDNDGKLHVMTISNNGDKDTLVTVYIMYETEELILVTSDGKFIIPFKEIELADKEEILNISGFNIKTIVMQYLLDKRRNKKVMALSKNDNDIIEYIVSNHKDFFRPPSEGETNEILEGLFSLVEDVITKGYNSLSDYREEVLKMSFNEMVLKYGVPKDLFAKIEEFEDFGKGFYNLADTLSKLKWD